MSKVQRSLRQKVVGGAAVAVLLGGGAFAAVSATGQGNGHDGRHARDRVQRVHTRDLAAAASYLDISTGTLANELRDGKSLAQVAAASGRGKSADGLVAAIVAERKARLAKTAANLPKRVSAEVQRPGATGPRGARAHGASALALFAAPGHLGDSAARYLGVPLAQLRSELRAGKTLAQLAAASPGKSEDGLVAALVAARQQRIAARVAGSSVAQAHAKRREEHLQKRMSALAERKFARSASS
jgi:hypothetical protein